MVINTEDGAQSKFRATIEVQNLSKNYGAVQAVSDVSFSVGSQQVVGFLGPNGAGKTTIMKILTGFHFPASGKAFVDGIAVDEHPLEVKRRIGYLPENVPLYGDLTVDEYMNFAAQARSIPKQERKAAINKSLKSCGLTSYRGRKIETLSKGYRQRAGLAQAILHDPPILILDEPTTGLDPNQIIEIRALIKELGKRKTVILSTHILQEVEAICSQVLIINDGRIAAQGKPDEIADYISSRARDKVNRTSGGNAVKGGDTWELVLKINKEQPAVSNVNKEIKNKLSLLSDVSNIYIEGSENNTVTAHFFLPVKEDMDSGELIFDWAVNHGIKILGMSRKKLSIEDIFVKLTSEERNK